ncbi:MAG: DEAD/DEAH box helicase [Chloroflexota bacterium]|nr:DEAD/DEAH box helicase [Chloroflexota bacterium]
MSFDKLGLSPELLRAVADRGYTEPTPVQREAIPHVLAGRDLLAAAQTGTGKTAAFVLPILQRLSATPAAHDRAGVRVLVLTPTRELAVQIEESVRTYGAHLPIRSAIIYGGVPMAPQVAALRRSPEIVVATPGRLLDHTWQGNIDYGAVEVCVLDEADRMLDMGFIDDIRQILSWLPAQRQNLLFSATFSDSIKRLSAKLLREPASVQATPSNTATELVRQVVHLVDRDAKSSAVVRLVRSGEVRQALIFVRTKHGADKLASHLSRAGIRTAAIHSNKGQLQREAALEDFKAGNVNVLVATEVAARGLDIAALPHVVNYELPTVTSDYVHRIGRTGRAGIDGVAISLVSPEELPQLADIERLLGRAIPREPIPVSASTPMTGGQRLQDGRGTHRPSTGRRPANRSGGWSGLPGERRANVGVGGG